MTRQRCAAAQRSSSPVGAASGRRRADRRYDSSGDVRQVRITPPGRLDRMQPAPGRAPRTHHRRRPHVRTHRPNQQRATWLRTYRVAKANGSPLLCKFCTAAWLGSSWVAADRSAEFPSIGGCKEMQKASTFGSRTGLPGAGYTWS